ncbi:MAG: OB-fold domain-containing protein [Proteobacteria bacterium]|nr:OB-fold domain-containing protein [Pseudomonadota bacterium]
MQDEIVSDIEAFEATFQRLIEARDLRVACWAGSRTVLGYGTRAPSAEGERQVAWVAASGAATLHSFCIYHRAYHADFPPPYNVALVALAEGPHLVSTVIAAPVELRVGMALTAAFEPSGRLVFHPRNAGAVQ